MSEVWRGMIDGEEVHLHEDGTAWAKVDGGLSRLTGGDAKNAWREAFFDLREMAKKVVEARTNLDKAPTLTREYDRCNTALNDAIGDLTAKIGLER